MNYRLVKGDLVDPIIVRQTSVLGFCDFKIYKLGA